MKVYGDMDTLHLMLDNKAIHIKYVHQLQNLYFALNEEELELKS